MKLTPSTARVKPNPPARVVPPHTLRRWVMRQLVIEARRLQKAGRWSESLGVAQAALIVRRTWEAAARAK